MKKKIKDLSEKELKAICEKHKCNLECPLVIGHDDFGVFCFLNNARDEEVEIDE